MRDRAEVAAEEKIRFTSSILPKWARRTRSLDALLPVLYLRGVSAGDFQEGLAALLGKDAPNLSPAVISRLTAEWQADCDAWQKRDLSARRYVYVWADGVYMRASDFNGDTEHDAKTVMDRMYSNLTVLWNDMPDDQKTLWRDWYVGAHDLVTDRMEQYREHGIGRAAMTAMYAAQSPNTQWDVNVHLEEQSHTD